MLAGVLVVGAVVALVFSLVVSTQTDDPFSGRELYVYPYTDAAKAAQAASGEEKAAFERIARTPTAVWLTPEEHPTERVADFVSGVVSDAAASGSLPVFVVYGIPDRDCSNHSAGGATPDAYPDWLGQIRAGIVGEPAVLILEPDSLALAPSCGNAEARVTQISEAIEILRGNHITIYLDGGHSHFLPAENQAELLERAGVDRVRGFASNIANFNPTHEEVAYDEKVASLVGGSHFVIDTSRNGNGSNGEWCNPPGRALGEAPRAIADPNGHDANLWIKHPGESDGECNGGPAAGQWWPEGALALANG